MTKLGIMEGRLVPPEPGRFQSFPRARWADEFALARRVPLSYIEWIVDVYGLGVNPLPTQIERLAALSRTWHVGVRSICADYFMERPFVRCTEPQFVERREYLQELVAAAGRLGVHRVVVPFVDQSAIRTREDEERALRMLTETLPAARRANVELHLETALSPAVFAAFLARIDDPLVRVNYDSGNSASLGYRVQDEFSAYGARVGSVHVKDRVRGGGTLPLGSGDVDFVALFASMRAVRYAGDITLQVARGEAGDEVAWTRTNRAFVERFWPIE